MVKLFIFDNLPVAKNQFEMQFSPTLLLLICFFVASTFAMKDSMIRKSIVFDKNTPDVFYCPIQKPSGMDKLIVKARPLKKLCEFEGQTLPEDYKSDCYQDVDESNFACKEKYRIMTRIKRALQEE